MFYGDFPKTNTRQKTPKDSIYNDIINKENLLAVEVGTRESLIFPLKS